MRRVAIWGAALALLGAAAMPVVAEERASAVRLPPMPVARPAPVNTADIRIGLILGNGSQEAIADDITAGLTLALSEPTFGLGGRKVVLMREMAERSAVENAKLLLEAKANILLGPATARDVVALRDLADSRGVPLIVPVAGAGVLASLKCSPFVLHVTPAGDQVAGPLGAWAGAQKPTKRIYLIAPEEAASRSQVATFKRHFLAAGGEVVGEEYVPAANPDFSPYLAKLRLVGADSVYAPFAGDAAKAFVRDYEAQGLFKRVALLGTSEFSVATAKAAMVGGNIGGLIGAVDYVPAIDSPENGRFQIDFAKRFGRMPSLHAARGYDAGRLIIEALRSIGGKTDDPAVLASALTNVSIVGPRGLVRAAVQGGATVDRLYIVRARQEENGRRYDLIDRVPPALARAETCPAPAN